MRFQRLVIGFVVLVSFAGCAYDTVGASTEEVRVGRSAEGIVIPFATRDNLPQGLAADSRYLFVTEPLSARVVVMSRASGNELATVPAPPDGPFLLPFQVRTAGPGRFVVLDPGGFPNPAGPALPARLIEYDYETLQGNFVATHVRTISMAGLPIIFADDVAPLGDGSYAVVEPIIGAIWRILPDGTVIPAVFPASPFPEDAIPALAPCFAPEEIDVDGVPFRSPGDFLPGVASVTSDDTYLYFGTTCSGGLYRLPLAVLDDARAPWDRADDIELLSPPPPDSDIDSLKGLSVDIYGDPDFMYAADPFNVQLVRIDLRTGEREVVLTDGHLFNFVVNTAFIPPTGSEPAQLITVSDQEHRWTALNAAITEDQFELPFILTRVILRR
jgi:hypothetical protein